MRTVLRSADPDCSPTTRRGSCGIPSTWRSPTARWPGGSSSSYRACFVKLCPRDAVW